MHAQAWLAQQRACRREELSLLGEDREQTASGLSLCLVQEAVPAPGRAVFYFGRMTSAL